MIKVLVTGKDSQLSQCIKDIEKQYPKISFIYKNSKELDITDKESIKRNFEGNNYNFCINCAAYTAVDNAEIEFKKAKNINIIGALNLALACKKSNTVLIHISTDFVFDGMKTSPYIETDKTNPLGIYGLTKRDGENEIKKTFSNYYIIRTSWLYSVYSKNFLKSMLNMAESQKKINVVNDQIGSPTNANDLANFICHILGSKKNHFGVYHFCNSGKTSWYNFARQIFLKWNIDIALKPIKSAEYNTKAKRPRYSVLDTSKIERIFSIKPSSWEESLSQFYITYNKD